MPAVIDGLPISNEQLSNVITAYADTLAGRVVLTASEGVALHCMRLAARMLFHERAVASDWHELLHRLFDTIELPLIGDERLSKT